MPDPTDTLDTGDALAAILRRFYPALIEAAFVDAAGLGLTWRSLWTIRLCRTCSTKLAKEVVGVVETTRDEIPRWSGDRRSRLEPYGTGRRD